MLHAKRLGAATLASSISLLTTFGLTEAIRATEEPPALATGGAQKSIAWTSGARGPSRILVIRRSAPSVPSSRGGTVYVQAPAPAPAPPPIPTTRSS